MLPALALDGRIITESDDILLALEAVFGPLHLPLAGPEILPLRRLERELFRAWCNWLCQPLAPAADARAQVAFVAVVARVEGALFSTPGPFFLSSFSSADVIFTPYIERMAASLFYYKGYTLRDPVANPRITSWFDAMDSREAYRGLTSDFHTHVHDLPPQMGGCYSNGSLAASANQRLVDGPWSWPLPVGAWPVTELSYGEGAPGAAVTEAFTRVLRHKEKLVQAMAAGCGAPLEAAEVALHCGLSNLMGGQVAAVPPAGSDVLLRYVRDRVSVPRDMGIHAARALRAAMEATAAAVGTGQGPPIPTTHRRDQDPARFVRA
jgi:glutathione S-transferase